MLIFEFFWNSFKKCLQFIQVIYIDTHTPLMKEIKTQSVFSIENILHIHSGPIVNLLNVGKLRSHPNTFRLVSFQYVSITIICRACPRVFRAVVQDHFCALENLKSKKYCKIAKSWSEVKSKFFIGIFLKLVKNGSKLSFLCFLRGQQL